VPFGFFQNRTIGGVWAFLNSLVILRDVLSGQFISMILDAAMVPKAPVAPICSGYDGSGSCRMDDSAGMASHRRSCWPLEV